MVISPTDSYTQGKLITLAENRSDQKEEEEEINEDCDMK